MKSKTLKIVIAVIFVFIAVTASLIISNAIKTKKENLAFQEKYAISSSLAGIYEGKVKIIDYSDGSVEYMSFEEYSDFSGEEIIVQVENDVFSFENGEKTFLFSTEHRGKHYFRIEDDIYFVAANIGDTDALAEIFLWIYADGKIEKPMRTPVHYFDGNILIYNGGFIFANAHNQIMMYNPEEKSQKKICNGRAVCWKEEGKSFFVCTEWGISLYDLETREEEILIWDSDVYFSRGALYNEENAVLISCTISHEYDRFSKAIYYFDFDEIVDVYEYTKKMEIERDNFLIGFDYFKWIISDPIGWI